jgi:hypothetical protein
VDIDSCAWVLKSLLNIAMKCQKVKLQNGEILFIIGPKKQEMTHLRIAGAGSEGAFAIDNMCERMQKSRVMGWASTTKPNTGAWDYLIRD